jgi:hypothetical protein
VTFFPLLSLSRMFGVLARTIAIKGGVLMGKKHFAEEPIVFTLR